MTPWERKIWDSDALTGFVVALCVMLIAVSVYLAGWIWLILGGRYWLERIWR